MAWDWLEGGIKKMTGAGPGEGYLPDSGRFGTKEKAMQEAVDAGIMEYANNSGQPTPGSYGSGAQGLVPDWLTGGVPTKQALGMGGVGNFDMNNPESVKALQERLGVKADGMFGPQTEAAYRKAIDGERQAAGKESYSYDYNEGGPAPKGLGGWLKNAYSNIDEKVGGVLPGGYKKDISNMTAEEYANR
ncbi:MAG: hypothetical protein CMM25_05445 [Rhodospirillaceae bacterium]|nr:hypothetical protein [Rhodospirillaceae bacterium]